MFEGSGFGIPALFVTALTVGLGGVWFNELGGGSFGPEQSSLNESSLCAFYANTFCSSPTHWPPGPVAPSLRVSSEADLRDADGAGCMVFLFASQLCSMRCHLVPCEEGLWSSNIASSKEFHTVTDNLGTRIYLVYRGRVATVIA
jgi:hypothetical protein